MNIIPVGLFFIYYCSVGNTIP